MTGPCDETLEPVDPEHTIQGPAPLTLEDDLEEHTLADLLPEHTLEEVC